MGCLDKYFSDRNQHPTSARMGLGSNLGGSSRTNSRSFNVRPGRGSEVCCKIDLNSTFIYDCLVSRFCLKDNEVYLTKIITFKVKVKIQSYNSKSNIPRSPRSPLKRRLVSLLTPTKSDSKSKLSVKHVRSSAEQTMIRWVREHVAK